MCSNVATANVVLPILLTLSRTINIHPLYLTVPATISCSFAFMVRLQFMHTTMLFLKLMYDHLFTKYYLLFYASQFPVATPPNALVFSAGNLRIMDMVSTGIFLNITCIVIYFLLQISYGELFFGYSKYEWPAGAGGDFNLTASRLITGDLFS